MPTSWEQTPTPAEKYHLWNTEVQKTIPGLLGVEGIRDPAPRVLPTKLHTAIDLLRNRDPTHVAEHRARNILQHLAMLGAATTKTAYTELKLALLVHPWVRGNRALTKAVQTTPHGMFPRAHWARGLHTKATSAVDEARATRTARWQTFLDTELTKGAGFQHKWTKPTQEQPDHTISLEEELSKTRAQWASYWEAREHTLAAPNLQWPTIAPATPLDAQDLRRAAKTFSPKSSAICGWHPRTLGCLGEAHLTMLAELYQQAENTGDYPNQLRHIVVRMLPKPGSWEKRPIGLYPGAVRLHFKSRVHQIQIWQDCHPSTTGSMNMRATRQTSDGVWRSRIRTHLAHSLGHWAGEILLDVSKAYENVSWTQLKAAAEMHDYPLHLLRLGIATYGWPRHIVGEADTAAAPITPTRGIIAGSSFATFEMDLYTIGFIALTIKKWEASALHFHMSIHVDDLSIEMIDSSQAKILTKLPEATLDLAATMLEDYSLPVAPKKTAIIASTPGLALGIARRLGCTAAATPSTRRLGVDHTLGNRDRQPVRRNRFIVAARRKTKIRKLRHRRSQYRVAAAGIMPSLMYGTSVVAPTPAHHRALRSWAVQFASSGGRGCQWSWHCSASPGAATQQPRPTKGPYADTHVKCT
jgi:hypothetical protein